MAGADLTQANLDNATDRDYWAEQVAGMEEGTSLVSRTAPPAINSGIATAALSPGDIASPIRFVLGRQRNTSVLLAEATAIDTANRR